MGGREAKDYLREKEGFIGSEMFPEGDVMACTGLFRGKEVLYQCGVGSNGSVNML